MVYIKQIAFTYFKEFDRKIEKVTQCTCIIYAHRNRVILEHFE